MDQPNWNDLHTAEEWADRLDDLADLLARHLGDLSIGDRERKASGYAIAGELRNAGNCIRELSALADAGADLAADAEELRRQLKAGVESLTRKPS